MRLKGENCLKRLIPKNVGSLKKQIVEKFDSDRKKINLISSKSFKYLNQYFSMHDRKNLIFHNIFFKFFYDLRVTFESIHSCLRIFDNEDDIFIFFSGIFENPAPTVKQVVSEIKIFKKSKIS